MAEHAELCSEMYGQCHMNGFHAHWGINGWTILNFILKNCSESTWRIFLSDLGHFWSQILYVALDKRHRKRHRTERKRNESYRVFGLWHLLERALPKKTNRTVLDTVLRLNIIWYKNFQECDTMPNEQFIQLLTIKTIGFVLPPFTCLSHKYSRCKNYLPFVLRENL